MIIKGCSTVPFKKLKASDGAGNGQSGDVVAAVDYAVANRARHNIRVINLSVAAGVYGSYRTDPLAQAALRAVSAGIVVVPAAGNFGVGRSTGRRRAASHRNRRLGPRRSLGGQQQPARRVDHMGRALHARADRLRCAVISG